MGAVAPAEHRVLGATGGQRLDVCRARGTHRRDAQGGAQGTGERPGYRRSARVLVAMSRTQPAKRTVKPERLMQAHELLSQRRPAPEAGPAAWLAYYRSSAAVYAEVAEIDRGH